MKNADIINYRLFNQNNFKTLKNFALLKTHCHRVVSCGLYL